MAAEDFIGLQGPEYRMDIERGKVREFARAMNAPLPEYIDAEHPLIPATFLITAVAWGGDDNRSLVQLQSTYRLHSLHKVD